MTKLFRRAIFWLLTFSIIQVYSGALQTSTQEINPFNEFMAPEGGIDLLSGVSSFPQKIYTLSGRGGMDIDVALKYSSNVMFNVNASNDIASTGWVGLGWSLGYGSIRCEHNGTPALYDDRYYWISPEGVQKEIIRKRISATEEEFYLEGNPYWKIKKVVLDPINYPYIIIGWILYDTDGKKYKYGNLDDEFDRNAIRYTFAWEHHVGEGWDFGDASFKRYPYQWDLATMEDVYGNAINFIYEQEQKKVVHKLDNSDDSLYTKASYLKKIINPEGAEIVFEIKDKNKDEFMDPYSLLPEPDGFIELFEEKYLSKIFIKNQYGEPIREFLFCYSAINKKDEIGEELGNKKYEKRLLTNIEEKNGDGKKLSSFAFEYFDEIASTEGFAEDPDTNYNYGALKSIRSSMCGRIDFSYEKETFLLAREDIIDDQNIQEGEMHKLYPGYDHFHDHSYLSVGRLSNGTYYHTDFRRKSLHEGHAPKVIIKNLSNTGSWQSYEFVPIGISLNINKARLRAVGDYVLLEEWRFSPSGTGDGWTYWIFNWDGEKWIKSNIQNYVLHEDPIKKTYVGRDYIVGLEDKVDIHVLNFNHDTKTWFKTIDNVDLGDNHEKWIYCGEDYFAVKGERTSDYIWVYNWNDAINNWEKSNIWKYRPTWKGGKDDYRVFPGKNFFVLRGDHDGESLWFFNWDGTKWVKTKTAKEKYGNNDKKHVVVGDNYVVIQGGDFERKVWALHWNGSKWVTKLSGARPKDEGSRRDNSLYGGNNYFIKITGKHRHLQYMYNWDGSKWTKEKRTMFKYGDRDHSKIGAVITGKDFVATRFWSNGSIVEVWNWNGKDWKRSLNDYKIRFLPKEEIIVGSGASAYAPRLVTSVEDLMVIHAPVVDLSAGFFNFMGDFQFPYSYRIEERTMSDGTGDSAIVNYDQPIEIDYYIPSDFGYNYNTLTFVNGSPILKSGTGWKYNSQFDRYLIEKNITSFGFIIDPQDYYNDDNGAFYKELFGATKIIKSDRSSKEFNYSIKDRAVWPRGIRHLRLDSYNDILDNLNLETTNEYNENNGLVKKTTVSNSRLNYNRDSKFTEKIYAFEELDVNGDLVYADMVDSNMISQLLETKLTKVDANEISLFSANVQTWSKTNKTGQWAPDQQYIWNANNSDANEDYVEFDFSNVSANVKPWQLASEIDTYDEYGNILCVKNGIGTNITTITGRSGKFPIAGVQNASFDECAVFTCDYDDDVTSSTVPQVTYLDEANQWIKSSSGCKLINCKTEGIEQKFSENVVRIINGGKIYKYLSGVDKNKSYVLSVWVRSFASSGSGLLRVEKVTSVGSATTLKEFPFTITQSWVLIQTPVSSTDLASLGTTDEICIAVEAGASSFLYLNDVRFYPENALVSTMYYDPLWLSQVAAVDANNNGSSVELDEFGRPVVWRDNKRNILQEKEYKFMACYRDVSDNLLKRMDLEEKDFEFDPWTNTYTVVVPNAVTDVSLYAAAKNPESYVIINNVGTECPCAQSKNIPLDEDGLTEISVDVEAPNGAVNPYTLNVVQLSNCWQYLGAQETATEQSTNQSSLDERNGNLLLAYQSSADGDAYVNKYDFGADSWDPTSTDGINASDETSISMAYPYLACLTDKTRQVTDPGTGETFEEEYSVVYCSYYNGSSWTPTGTDGSVSEGLSEQFDIDINSSNIPYVAYIGEEGTEASKVLVKNLSGGNWVPVGGDVSDAGSVSDVTIDVSNNIPYVAYIFNTSPDNENSLDKIVIRQYSAGSWTDVGPVFSGSGVEKISLFVDNGTPYIAYSIEDVVTVLKLELGSWTALGGENFLPLGNDEGYKGKFKIFVRGATPYLAFTTYYNFDKYTVIEWSGSEWVSFGNPAFTPGTASPVEEANYVVSSTDDKYISFINEKEDDKTSVMTFNESEDCPDATLQSITLVGAGTVTFTPEFKPYLTRYVTTVDNTVSSVTVNAQASDNQAYSVRVNAVTTPGDLAQVPVNLHVGENDIKIVVTGNDEKTTVNYYLKIKRPPSSYAALCNIELFDKDEEAISFYQKETPANDFFDPNVTDYTANVSVDDDIVKFVFDNRSNAKILFNGSPIYDAYVSKPDFGFNTYEIIVTAQDKETSIIYNFEITRDVDTRVQLSNLSVNQGGILQPSFSINTYSYRVFYNHDITEMTLTPTASDGSANIRINNEDVASGSPSNPVSLSYGSNYVSVKVSHPDLEKTSFYFIEVVRRPYDDVALDNFSVVDQNTAPVVLNPSFAYDEPNYNSAVAADVTQVTLNYTKRNTNALIEIGELSEFYNEIHSEVILNSLTSNVGTLAPAFNQEIFEYYISVSSATTEIILTISGEFEEVAFNDLAAERVCFLDGSEIDCNDCGEGVNCEIFSRSEPIPLVQGRNPVEIVLTGSNQNNTGVYYVNVIRGADQQPPVQTTYDVFPGMNQYGIKLTSPDYNKTMLYSLTVNKLIEQSVNPVISFKKGSDKDYEGNKTIKIQVELSSLPELPVTVDYTVLASSTATPVDDYVLENGSLEFEPCEQIKEIELVLKEDYLVEGDETVDIQLSNVNNAVSGSTMDFTFTILDNDFAKVSYLTEDPTEVMEGDAGVQDVTITVQLSAAHPQTTRVRYAVVEKSSGLDASDYLIESNTLTYAAGDTEEDIVVKVNGDTDYEADEWMIIKLFPQEFLENGDIIEHQLIIKNDDTPPATVSFDVTAGESYETNTISISVVATLDQPIDQTLTVPFTLGGNALVDVDYDIIFPDPDLEVTFGIGETEASIVFSVINDDVPEETEEFQFILQNPQPEGIAVLNPGKKVYTHRIIDEPYKIAFTSTQSRYKEGELSSYHIQVTVSPPPAPDQTITVPFTLSGTAIEDDDYSIIRPKNRQLTFTNDYPVAYIGYFDADDPIREPDETILFTLGTPQPQEDVEIVDGKGVHTRVIVNDDGYRILFTEIFSSSGEDGQTHSAYARIEPAPDAGLTITVPFTISGTATDGDDFWVVNPKNQQLVFDAQNTTDFIEFFIAPVDGIIEGDETVIFTLETPQPSNIAEVDEFAKIFTHTIKDCDCRVVYFEIEESFSAEYDHLVTVNVKIEPPLPSGTTVNVPLSFGGTATLGADYSLTSPQEVTFYTGDEIAPFNLIINPDTEEEDNETIEITLETPSGPATIGKPNEHTHRIISRIYVDKDNQDGPWDGLNWGTAYKELHDGLDYINGSNLSEVGNIEVWVAEGIYKPTQIKEERNKSFIIFSNTFLYGGFQGTEISKTDRDYQQYKTYLSGIINPDAGMYYGSFHIVTLNNIKNVAIDGFIITGGSANGDNYQQWNGAGLESNASSFELRNCAIKLNFATHLGGGIKIQGDGGQDIIIENCRFSQNQVIGSGGGLEAVSVSAPLIIKECIFENNNAFSELFVGGGATIGYCDNFKCVNSLFIGNTSEWNAGGLDIIQSTASVINCTFHANLAKRRGGGISVEQHSNVTIYNCILWENDIPPEMELPDNNFENDIYIINAEIVTISHSCIKSEDINTIIAGNNNINGRIPDGSGWKYPATLFQAPGTWSGTSWQSPSWENGDYHLKGEDGYWPCRNSGGDGGDIPPPFIVPSIDRVGAPRPDHPDSRYDMGCYEELPAQ